MFLWEIPVHNFTFSFQCKQTFYSCVLWETLPRFFFTTLYIAMYVKHWNCLDWYHTFRTLYLWFCCHGAHCNHISVMAKFGIGLSTREFFVLLFCFYLVSFGNLDLVSWLFLFLHVYISHGFGCSRFTVFDLGQWETDASWTNSGTDSLTVQVISHQKSLQKHCSVNYLLSISKSFQTSQFFWFGIPKLPASDWHLSCLVWPVA